MIKVIIGLILLVCICSGAFSVMTHYNPTNNSDVDNRGSSSIIGNTNEDIKSIENNPIMNYIDNIDDSLEHVSEYFVANTMGMLEHYTYGADNLFHLDYFIHMPSFDDYSTHESDGTVHSIITYMTPEDSVHNEKHEILPDKYYPCTECGKWIPANEITHPLPETELCHCEEAGLRGSSSSIDDTVAPIENNDSTPVFTGIYCNDCDGYVILNNYDDSKNLNLYFELMKICVPINNIGSITKLCSHHNGTLDLFDTPIEDFHLGWFRSIYDYNQFMYKAIHSLNDNSTSLENKTLNDMSFEKWNIWDVEDNFSYVEYKSLNKNDTSIDTNINETLTPADKNVIDEVVYREDNETYIEDFNQDLDNKEP